MMGCVYLLIEGFNDLTCWCNGLLEDLVLGCAQLDGFHRHLRKVGLVDDLVELRYIIIYVP